MRHELDQMSQTSKLFFGGINLLTVIMCCVAIYEQLPAPELFTWLIFAYLFGMNAIDAFKSYLSKQKEMNKYE